MHKSCSHTRRLLYAESLCVVCERAVFSCDLYVQSPLNASQQTTKVIHAFYCKTNCHNKRANNNYNSSTGIDSKRNANPNENKNYGTLNGNKKIRVKKSNESVTEKSITLDLAIQVTVSRTHIEASWTTKCAKKRKGNTLSVKCWKWSKIRKI